MILPLKMPPRDVCSSAKGPISGRSFHQLVIMF